MPGEPATTAMRPQIRISSRMPHRRLASIRALPTTTTSSTHHLVCGIKMSCPATVPLAPMAPSPTAVDLHQQLWAPTIATPTTKRPSSRKLPSTSRSNSHYHRLGNQPDDPKTVNSAPQHPLVRWSRRPARRRQLPPSASRVPRRCASGRRASKCCPRSPPSRGCWIGIRRTKVTKKVVERTCRHHLLSAELHVNKPLEVTVILLLLRYFILRLVNYCFIGFFLSLENIFLNFFFSFFRLSRNFYYRDSL